jgi:hypothetical protein
MLQPPQQRRKRPRHKDNMQQPRLNKTPVLLSAVLALVLLGAVATLGLIVNGRGLRAAGMMPEVVSIADRSDCVTGEIVVRAPNRLAVAATQVSGINQ